MNITIRSMVKNDIDAIVELSILAWEPVFISFEKVLGPDIFPILYPDWKTSQAEGVATTCKDKDFHILVADVEGAVAGFIAYKLHDKDKTGEVDLLAVHPDYQNMGIGTMLNTAALDNMREAGMQLAVVGTGGEEGHAPARRSYEKAGYTGLPLVRYYQKL